MNIGIILPDMGVSQLAYMAINQCNICANITDDSYFIFFEDMQKPCVKPTVACMNVSELHTFEGLLVSTSIETTLTALSCVTNSKKIFYVWDLEWIRNKNDFLYNMKAFRNEQVELMCRSEQHAKLVHNYSNRKPSLIFNNFNLLALREHTREKRSYEGLGRAIKILDEINTKTEDIK